MTPEEILALYAPIASDVAEVSGAMRKRIDREARQHLEAQHEGYPWILLGTLLVAQATFSAAKRLCFDRTDGARPPIELASAVPPLTRTFLDSMIAVMFVAENPGKNVERYFRAGLCTELARYHRLSAEYGSDPTWSSHIAGVRGWIDTRRLELSDEQKQDPRAHARKLWPNPGKLIRECSQEVRAYLRFVQEWFYDHLSQDAHLSYMGLVRRSAPLHEQTPPGKGEEYRWRAFYSALILYLALLAEVALAADLPFERARIATCWKHLTGMSDADQLWKRRYRLLLTGRDSDPRSDLID